MIDTVQQLLRQLPDDDSEAIRYGADTWTWRQYLTEAAAEASALIGLADPNRPLHVGVLLDNSPAMLRSMAAAALGGYVLCGINTTRRGEALLADIRRSDCQIVLVDAGHARLLDAAALPGIVLLDVTTQRYLDAIDSAPPLRPYREVTGEDPLMLIFTSGTSGNPKAVPIRHAAVVMSGASLAVQLDITAADVCYLSMPLFHSNGIAGGWAVALYSGATMVPARFSPAVPREVVDFGSA